MRNYYLLVTRAVIVALFSPLFLVAQQTKNTTAAAPIDARLYAAYGSEYINRLAQEDPFLVKRWTFYLDHAFFISDTPLSKDGSDADLQTVKVPDLTKINILQLEKEQPQLQRDFYSDVVYKIEGTGKYLVYYSGQSFIEKLKEKLKTE